jgi:uncharacterized membrane protein YqjE
MPTWNFVRDSLMMAAVVILLAWAVALTVNLILAYTGDGASRASSNSAVTAVSYLLAAALLFVLWKSQERPSRA